MFEHTNGCGCNNGQMALAGVIIVVGAPVCRMTLSVAYSRVPSSHSCMSACMCAYAQIIIPGLIAYGAYTGVQKVRHSSKVRRMRAKFGRSASEQGAS